MIELAIFALHIVGFLVSASAAFCNILLCGTNCSCSQEATSKLQLFWGTSLHLQNVDQCQILLLKYKISYT